MSTSEFRTMLVTARVNARQTKVDIATKARVTRQTVAAWESGDALPQAAAVPLLAAAYGLPASLVREAYLAAVRETLS